MSSVLKKKKRFLVLHFLVPLVVIIIASTALSAFIIVSQTYTAINSAFDEVIKSNLDMINRSMTSAVWNFDDKLAVDVAKPLIENENYKSLIVYFADGSVFSMLNPESMVIDYKELGKSVEERNSLVPTKIEIGQEDYVYLNLFKDSEFIGRIFVSYTNDSLFKALVENILWIIFLSVITIVIKVVAVYYVIKGVSSSIETLSDMFRRLTSASDNELIKVENVQASDVVEITTLQNAARDYATLLELNRELLRESEQSHIQTRERYDYISKVTNEFYEELNSVFSDMSDTAATLYETAGGLRFAASNSDESIKKVNTQTGSNASHIDDLEATFQQMNQSQEKITSFVSRLETTDSKVFEDTETLNQELNEYSSHLESVQEVIKQITEISDQTTLLALNATIEAARAGEAGAGFGVVAAQVQELANQTKIATQNINEFIGSIEECTRKAQVSANQISQSVSNSHSESKNIVAVLNDQSNRLTNLNVEIEKVQCDSQAALTVMSELSMAIHQSSLASGALFGSAEESTDRIEKLSETIDKYLAKIQAA